MQSKKIFYGWVNVIACSLVLAIGMGVLSNAAGVFIKPVCDSLGFARGNFSSAPYNPHPGRSFLSTVFHPSYPEIRR